MPRPATKGFKYFPVDVTILQDRKIRRLRRICGVASPLCRVASPLVYIALLTAIYDEGYYVKYNDDLVFDIADTLEMEEDDVRAIIKGCISVGLFSKEMADNFSVLTSHGIQTQYKKTNEQLKRRDLIKDYSLLVSSDNSGKNPTNEDILPDNSGKNPTNEDILPDNSGKNPTNEDILPDNSGKSTQKRIEENRREKNNFSSPKSSSSSCEEELSAEEEKEKIVKILFFESNIHEPNHEYERLVSYNNNPEKRKKWGDMSMEEKESCARLWHPKPEDTAKHKGAQRFPRDFLNMWARLFCLLESRCAPAEVRMAALDDDVGFSISKGILILSIPKALYGWIEVPEDDRGDSNLDYVKPIFREFMRTRGCNSLVYANT